jgi:hypothetical protein
MAVIVLLIILAALLPLLVLVLLAFGASRVARHRQQRFRAEMLGARPQSSAQPRARIVARLPEAAASTNGRVRVEADRRPLWEARGWRRVGDRLRGAYRTPRGSCSGEIVVDGRMRPLDFYIFNPAPELLADPVHGPCFRRLGNGRYWVHFNVTPVSVDAGIVQVETLLAGALARRTG